MGIFWSKEDRLQNALKQHSRTLKMQLEMQLEMQLDRQRNVSSKDELVSLGRGGSARDEKRLVSDISSIDIAAGGHESGCYIYTERESAR